MRYPARSRGNWRGASGDNLQLVLPRPPSTGARSRAGLLPAARRYPGFSQDLAQFEAAGIVLREIPMRRLPAPADRARRAEGCGVRNGLWGRDHALPWDQGRDSGAHATAHPDPWSTARTHSSFKEATGFKRILLLMLENMFVRQAAALICVSEAEEQSEPELLTCDLRRSQSPANGVPITSPANPAGFCGVRNRLRRAAGPRRRGSTC